MSYMVMLWRLGGWFLLLMHLFFPEPYREQLLAAQSIFITLAPKIMSFHIASALLCLLYVCQTDDIAFEWAAFILHHLLVFVFVISEYYFNEWRYTFGCVLFWSIRWMNTTNIYAEHPIRGCVRCLLFGFLTARQFSCVHALKWCWIFFVHEFCYVCIPVQMLHEVYFGRSVANTEEIV